MLSQKEKIIMSNQNFFSQGSEKIYYFEERLKRFLTKDVINPVVVEIHPTERCNHGCPQCQAIYAVSTTKKNMLKKRGADMDFTILEGLWETQLEGIVISGNTGDPLMHPDIGSLLDSIKEKNIPCLFFTNGQNLTEDIARKIFTTCRGVRISLDAHNADLYQKTHGVVKQAWDQVIANIKMCVGIKEELNHFCDFGIAYLTKELTREGMVPATCLARDIGVDYIQFRPFHFTFDDVTKELSMCEKLQTKKFKVYGSYQKYDLFHSIQRDYDTCHGANFYNVIDACGDVYMCCHTIKNSQAVLGNMYEKSWQEIIKSKQDVISQFSVADCIPLCRLHGVNTSLEKVKRMGEIPNIELSEAVKKHVMFL